MLITLIVFFTLLLFGLCILLVLAAAECQLEGIVVLGIVGGISSLVFGGILAHDIQISEMKRSQYNYEIQYNDTTYYTNDYILSNSGIEFEAEEGHFIYPIEGQEFKIKKTKKGDQ